MKFLIFLSLLIIIVESYRSGTIFLKCPNDKSMIDCNEVKCCPSDNKTCCLDESIVNEGIRKGCAENYSFLC